MVDQISAKAALDDRRAPRVEMRLRATLEIGRSGRHDVLTRNISADGLMIEFHADVVPGSLVQVKFPGLDKLPGTVAWQRAGHFGVAFNRPVTEVELAAIRAGASTER